MPKRAWTINGDFVALAPTGVARYARGVTAALDALLAEKHPLTSNLDMSIVSPVKLQDGLRLRTIVPRVVPEFGRRRVPQLWTQVQLPRHVRGGLLSFCNLGPVAVKRQILCIHDLHTRVMPESYGALFRFAHRALLPTLGFRSAYITTVSNFARDHLVKFRVAPKEKLIVTYNGHEHTKDWDPARSSFRIEPTRPFVLALGRNLKYKNTDLFWRIADDLESLGLDIYVAGEVDRRLFEHGDRGTPPNIRLLGRVTDDDFAKLLQHSLCFAFPSRIEGFGLPALEAMALGCPVVASDAASLPEVCGDASLYASPDDDAAWVRAIASLGRDRALRATLIAKGLVRAQQFSWREIALIYLSLMDRVDAGERSASASRSRVV